MGRGPQLADLPVRHGCAQPRADRLRRLSRSTARTRRRHLHAGNTNAKPDPLPDEAGGYSGYKALFGAKYVNPAITGGSPSVNEINGNPITDQFNQPGFPGFDGMFAEQHARRGRPDAGGRDPGDVRVHLRRARHARQRGRDPHRLRARRGRLRPAAQGLRQRVRRASSPGSRTTGSRRTTRSSSSPSRRATTSPAPRRTTPLRRRHGVLHVRAPGHTVTEVNGDLKRLVATYNASHGTSATTNFSVHSDLAPNVYITGNPARDSSTARTLEQAMSRHERDQPALEPAGEPVRGDGRPGRGEDSAHVDSRSGRTADVHAVRTRRLLPERLVDDPCANNDLSACVFLPNTAAPHADVRVEPRRHPAGDRIDVDRLGRARDREEGRAPTRLLHRPHRRAADDARAARAEGRLRRPTAASITEFLKDDALPKSLKGGKVEELGQAWKQINASFGQFAADTLTASTGALASNTLGDSHVHEHRERDPGPRQPSATRSRRRSGSRSGTPSSTARRSTRSRRRTGSARRTTWLDRAAGAGRRQFTSEPADAKELQKINHIVVIYEENHSFDNLYGGWEGVNGLANADAAHTTQVNQAGNAYACLKQNDVNLTSPPAADDVLRRHAGHAGRPVHEPLHERAVHDRRLHRADRHDVPAEPAAGLRAARTAG